MSTSWTSSTMGQMFGPHRAHVADSTVSNLISRKHMGTPPVANLFPDEICESKT
ncbi:hypothetical protein MTR67_026217 [Solanum verrucosum]|uniref:Uncharacterized protein n=1 Tax=Solanum verrucosum TaxID=315347 RepID=A0AAF0QYI0_SOLVR|nr:hypothetical protein MTR67_026217 [Solanum verrucosum]